ncbi:hypothetical protein SAMN05444365_104340 [Micromonospora pattaloongensis]|uniref:Uncharacterized protein n=1 Tax=Micromonospora pattaloongensis TaxID=405436 RepID=A0A1H3P5T8_9ACTN|nr:hypothetical protein [Micromonospora pattaloongensis]SDY96441.1 hypothetical protein SAMN05444365_104340 [Micromonospora pattaloongensis]
MTRTAPVPSTVIDPVGAPDTTRPAVWRRVTSVIGHRWPTWLALALAAVILWDLGDGSEFVFLLAIAAAGYLFMAVADRPRATWPVLFALVATVVVLRLLDIDPWPALTVVAAAFIALGLIGGQLRRPGLYALQSPAALGFIALGLAALSVSAGIGHYLVAAGLLGHAAWDAIHWRANTIVARSFAEWCGVLDVTLGLGILILAP